LGSQLFPFRPGAITGKITSNSSYELSWWVPGCIFMLAISPCTVTGSFKPSGLFPPALQK
ncbi:hypothetical protein, partial [Escherichia coli]|uniref:hypothetical protein n=1 Tax=Escherichia coli TaxID=562 RepID=UPI00390B5F5F